MRAGDLLSQIELVALRSLLQQVNLIHSAQLLILTLHSRTLNLNLVHSNRQKRFEFQEVQILPGNFVVVGMLHHELLLIELSQH